MTTLQRLRTADVPVRPHVPRQEWRLAWLDGLRGLAVCCVVFEHLSYHVFRGIRPVITPWFSLGSYGVLVFFLVSGYIVPASLERKGSVRGFWIGRFFRLYPLLALVLAIHLALANAGAIPFRGGESDHPAGSVLAHATMLQDLLNVTNALNVLWTLSYEMAFYLLVSAFFITGVHRRSAVIALVFAGAGIALGSSMPTLWLSHGIGTSRLALGVALLLLAGIACVTRDHVAARWAGALIFGGVVFTLMAVNSRVPWWEDMTILATMFSGTALYRAERGQTGRWPAVVVAIVVPALSVTSALTDTTPGHDGRQWATSIAAAWLTFGVAMALRHATVPRALCWLGVISYSLYLLHPLALDLLDASVGDQRASPMRIQFGLALGFTLMLLGTGYLLHRYVELPSQRLGRRLMRK